MNDIIQLYNYDGDLFDIYINDSYSYETIPEVFDIPSDDWLFMYRLAKNYYDYNGDLLINQTFKTFDGINYNENGYCLGTWIKNQRVAYSNRSIPKEDRATNVTPLSIIKIELLNNIGMVYSFKEASWHFMYDLACNYYNKYNNLDIPTGFRTFDGITYDKDGYNLYLWVFRQKLAYKNRNIVPNKRTNTMSVLSLEREELLNDIGFKKVKRKQNNKKLV